MFKFPYTNLHELNLDWILEKVKTLVENNDEFNDKADYAVETADEAKQIAEEAAQATIPDGSISTAKLADYAVTQNKLAVNSVGNNQLQDASVTNQKIYDGAVTTVKIDDEAVTTVKIDDEAVTDAKLSKTASEGNLTVTDGDSVLTTIWTAKVMRFGAIKLFNIAFNATISDTLSHYVFDIPSGFFPSINFEYLAIGENGGEILFKIYSGGYIHVERKGTNTITNELFSITIPVA